MHTQEWVWGLKAIFSIGWEEAEGLLEEVARTSRAVRCLVHPCTSPRFHRRLTVLSGHPQSHPHRAAPCHSTKRLVPRQPGNPCESHPEKGGGARGGASPVGENRASLPTTRGPAGVAASHPAAPLAEPAVSPARPEPLQARGSRRSLSSDTKLLLVFKPGSELCLHFPHLEPSSPDICTADSSIHYGFSAHLLQFHLLREAVCDHPFRKTP
ncbi:uncharacterized protein [Physeter macrocephalus]|uniref:Uncharacterized protein n=1 Tax=Physeter macrocephalus TaxID=9755 RepID=A0A455AYD3_PHYMC|nr:uncharacterized protein LOC114485113 [Physeter catodon]|eukprot:XP_028341547.1 uncharacterized protein LOC114485113 [Physeter catodon]